MAPGQRRDNMSNPSKPLVVHIEGNIMSGVSSVIQGLSARQLPEYNFEIVPTPVNNIVHTRIGDLCWAEHREAVRGISACVLEMSSYFKQRAHMGINPNTDIIIMDRSLASIRHVFHSIPDLMILRDVVDAFALNDLYESMEEHLLRPDMIIFIEASMQELGNRIRLTGDDHIAPETLVCIDKLYNKYLRASEAGNNAPTVVRITNMENTLAATIYRAHVAITELYYLNKLSKY